MKKVATTNKAEKIGVLSACAISLLQRGTRDKHQTQLVFDALAKDLGQEHFTIDYDKPIYPGQFGNSCSGCGGFIDDGGICNCGTDHWSQIPGPYAKTIPAVMSHEAQVTAMITQTAKVIKMASQKKEQENDAILNALQVYKEEKSILKQHN